MPRAVLLGLVLVLPALALFAAAATGPKHPVPKEHPRILGPRSRLQKLSRERAGAYRRTVDTARNKQADYHTKVISLALVSAIEGDAGLGKQAVGMAMRVVNGPIRRGHVTFGHDLAHVGIVYDLCHEHWTDAERTKYHSYVDKTVDANKGSERGVFHNGWYGYKNWGIGIASYASYYDNPRAKEHLAGLYKDYSERAAPALSLAGAGGGWAEGYYVNYWNYEWLFFCEVARHCEGRDLYETAPKFYRNRAIACMFEQYPPRVIYNSRRPVPMGDGGGRTYGGDRDKVLCTRRILVNRYRDEPFHRVVHTFNEETPQVGGAVCGYKDFLWRDTSVPKGNLQGFKLSHISEGAGYVHARSSWKDDSTYFYFKCGDRFTAHQHLDNGHFNIFRHEELAGDGGHYDGFGSVHDVNYHLRTIAHSTMLVLDPSEKSSTFYGGGTGIRAGRVTGNDGGQHYNFPNHNGDTYDPQKWHATRKNHDIADIAAFEDQGAYMYVAGDCTRAYSSKKVALFTRQIVYLRPGTFVVFDRVASTNPAFKKTWLLQAAKPPTGEAPNLVITNGKGRLFVQTVLPENPQVKLVSGGSLYSYGGRTYRPSRSTGAAPECRIEISPAKPSAADYFLNVLTAADASAASVPQLKLEKSAGSVSVTVPGAKVTFKTTSLGGSVTLKGKEFAFATKVHAGEAPKKTGATATAPRPKRTSSSATPAAASDEPKADPKAAKLFRSARQAERAGMKDMAKMFYERLVKEFPDDPLAERAKKKLEK